MKRRLRALLVCLMVCACIVPAAAYTPQVRYIDCDDSDGITIGPVMSYDAMVEYMVSEKDIPYREAMRSLSAEKGSAHTGQYRVLSVALTVNGKASYQPSLDFYCEVSAKDGVWGIAAIHRAQIDGFCNGVTGQFYGDISFWLRGPERIEYIVNGDFYGTLWHSYCYDNGIKRFT